MDGPGVGSGEAGGGGRAIVTDREKRLYFGVIYSMQATQCMQEVEYNAGLHVIRPDLQRRVERLRGAIRRLAREIGRELARGDATGTTDTDGCDRT